MLKGFAVHPLTVPQREVVINESLIRGAISFKPSFITEDDRIRVVGNQEKILREDKVRQEAAKMDLGKVEALLLSFRGIERIENLTCLLSLTKLYLDNNQIISMDGLECLVHLQWLDLSYNAIEAIAGLEALQELQVLSLFSNKIATLGGLTELPKLDTLSLGNNPLQHLDEAAQYLHQLPRLQVLTLKGCPLAAFPTYRSRIVAFVRHLKFLDGHRITKVEATKTREDQRENLQTVDEHDEVLAAAVKTKAEQAATASEYTRYNCPDDAKLLDELMRLRPEGRDMEAIMRSESVYPVAKDSLERHQVECNEQLKQLTTAMKEVRGRRDTDEAAYIAATAYVRRRAASQSQSLMRAFEALIKPHLPKGVAPRAASGAALSAEARESLLAAVVQLQRHLFAQEAQQYDQLEVLHNNTIATWKGDGVEVILQSAFEALLRHEADFQVSVRHIFDTVFEQRQKGDTGSRGLHYGNHDDAMLAFLNNKEEYTRVMNEWHEQRRKHIEELEMRHLKAEEALLTTRSNKILMEEQERHRQHISEVMEYVNGMANLIDGSSK